MNNGEGVRWQTVVLCIVAAFIAVLWTREAELYAFACQISEAVPPMTALAALLVLMAVSVIGRGMRRRGLPGIRISGQQIMYVYAFTMVATVIFSVGVLQTLVPEMTTLAYYAEPSNDFAAAQPHIKDWLQVADPEVARQLYEGVDTPPEVPEMGDIPVISPLLSFVARPIARTAIVPWRHWAMPIIIWSVFILLGLVTMQCIAGLAEQEWTVAERLPYPLVEIPLGITEQHDFVKDIPLLRDWVMWIGFIIGCVYGLHEMLASIMFFPQWGRQYALSALFTEHPFSELRGQLDVFLLPEAYGLAYFASQDVLLSTFLGWLAYCFFRVATAALGRTVPGTALVDASTGSFIAFVAAALWVARKSLRNVFRKALGLEPRDTPEQDRVSEAHGWMARGALLGTVLLSAFVFWLGVPLHYALFFVVLFLIVAIGHARVRAMAGAATPWLFPYNSMNQGFVRLFGSGAIGRPGDYAPFGALFHTRWVDRGYFESGLAAQLESYNMARRGEMKMPDMSRVLLLAIPIGLAFGWWMYLTSFYQDGGNILGGASTTGGVRTRYAWLDAEWAIGLVNTPTAPEAAAWVSLAVGALVTAASVLVRHFFLRSPLHPAGIVIALSHGSRFWAPFGLVWLIKGILLRLGGVRLYRRLMPGFLGVVVGHFFFTGIIMGLAKMTGLALFDKLPIIWF